MIQTDEHQGLRQSMSKKMPTAEAKKLYDARKITLEPTFGHIKIVDGIAEVAGEFSLMCTVYNFKKIIRAKIAWQSI